MAGEGIVELLPLGLTKATGLSLAARRLGVKAAETIAFGDMPNDIPMFAWAAYGVAMANAHEELKAVADEITPPTRRTASRWCWRGCWATPPPPPAPGAGGETDCGTR